MQNMKPCDRTNQLTASKNKLIKLYYMDHQEHAKERLMQPHVSHLNSISRLT